ncbi:hypothetical protein Ef30038_34120 [Escherichia fergusonii]|nr:hypothetical protein Ef30038_34120 [Escherichia fergusonii]
MICSRFGVVDNVVARKGVDDHLRQHRIDQQIALRGASVAGHIGGAGSDGVIGVRKINNITHRNAQRPDAAADLSAIRDIIQRHANCTAIGQIAGAA